jgi:hypothetical protein
VPIVGIWVLYIVVEDSLAIVLVGCIVDVIEVAVGIVDMVFDSVEVIEEVFCVKC